MSEWLTLGEAAKAIGVNQDTLRRWDRTGKLHTSRDDRNRRVVPAAKVRRLGSRRVRHSTGAPLSARNRLSGTVRSVEVDRVMALVELEAEPFLGNFGDDRKSELMRRRWMMAAITVLVLALAGCGSSSSGSGSGDRGSGGSKANLTVSAAASLKAAFTAYGQQFPQASVRYSFAGSDVLAAQIEQGIKPDVFASANTKLPDMLYAKGLVSKPVTFAANKLVIAVPANSKISSLGELEKPGVTIAIGSATVPIGAYTRKVLAKAGSASSAKILKNVRSEESDVNGIVGKLTEGAVDAGFTYVTDVKATKGALKAIALPASLQPVVAYGVAVVKGSRHPTQAQQFIAGLLSGAGQSQLTDAGFLPPPAK